MSTELNLKVKRFLVCSTGENMVFPEPETNLEAAIKLRDERQANDDQETWEIIAEIDA
ncbi:MAG: hypothetical protein KUG81_09900 [Gammaproteobacteria bacterium]|nr:hypothetical protein [Gammaproteobacteria bacterium]